MGKRQVPAVQMEQALDIKVFMQMLKQLTSREDMPAVSFYSIGPINLNSGDQISGGQAEEKPMQIPKETQIEVNLDFNTALDIICEWMLEEGVSFREVSTKIRIACINRLVKRDLCMKEIAEKLAMSRSYLHTFMDRYKLPKPLKMMIPRKIH